ncbi:MAG: hypothetical protein LBS43_09320 [Prevotellaceae bacterium]|jgi:uncharacterized protein YkwD|nr:hypothetical protein [Prevotellaceae bacterium]
MRTVKLFSVIILCSSILSCNNGTPSDAAADPLYATVPSIASCTAGALSDIEKQKILTYINSIRTAHKLPLVEYDSKKDAIAQDAALIGAANADISNEITETDFCYSPNAAQACREGDRSLWGSATAKWPTSEIHVNDWMTDSASINCRRRILDPFLKSITFGRIIGTPKRGDYKYVSSAMLVTGYGSVDLSDYDIPYIAYPEGVCEAKLFDANSFLSFSVLYDKYNKSNNGVSNINFSETTVEVSAGSQSLEIVGVYDYNNYGLPNSIQWKVSPELTKSVTYTVKINNVIVAGETKNYEYTFSFK